MAVAAKVENTHYREHISQDMLSQIMADVNAKLSAREQHILDKIDSTMLSRVKDQVERTLISAGLKSQASVGNMWILALLAVAKADRKSVV